MNNYNKIINFLLLCTVLLLSSCGDDYLEKEPSGSYLTGEQLEKVVKTNPQVTKGLITGLYNYMSTPEVGGTGQNEDFGQKANDMITDILSCDMAYTNKYGRYKWIANLADLENYRATVPHYMFWRYYYKIIYQANAIIASYGGNDIIPKQEEAKHLLGQAKAMRAYAYLYLAMYYTTEYKPNDKILILYKEPTTVPNAQVETKKIMEFVEKDLKDAISLLNTYNRENKSRINKNVAKGLLTYAYAYMGRVDEVITLSNEIITSNEFALTPKARLYSGMNTIANELGWMWGVDIVPDMNLNLTSFWGQIDKYTYGYAAFGGYKKIDNLMYASLNDKDLRKKQFDEKLLPTNKFFGFKKPAMRASGVAIEEDYVYMRVAEFYLLKAEALAKKGDDNAAKEALKPLLAERYETNQDYKYILEKSGQALKDEIYFQTRIELWGEGKSYFAMKRNKAKVKRGNNHSLLPNTEYNYDDSRLTLKVPKDEIENNPNVN